MSFHEQNVILIPYLQCNVVEHAEVPEDSIPTGVCYAPVQAHIPPDLWCHLPEWFLRAALVDSYRSERCLVKMFRGRSSNSFVLPSAGSAQPIPYQSRSAVVRSLQQRVPAAIFTTMLDRGIVKAIEDDGL